MSDRAPSDVMRDHGIAPELLDPPRVDRRGFLATLGGGILVLLTVRRSGAQEGRQRGVSRELPEDIAGWLHVGQDGAVAVYVGKVELGQNARTSLTQVVAEELCIDPATVRMVMGDTAQTPFDMGTFASRTTPYTVPPLRKAAAAARELLIGLAADEWRVERAELSVADGKVSHAASDRSATFGELTRGRELVETIAEDAPVIPPRDWRIVGTSVPKVGIADIVTGRQQFACDIKRPGMMHGKVLRPPAVNAALTSVDTAGAERLPGVVVCREDGFIGVVAPSEADAQQAIDAIRAEWDVPLQIRQEELYDHLLETAAEAREEDRHAQGSIEDGLAAADVTLTQTYTMAYIAHAALEPRSAVAEWDGDSVTVWAATQIPFSARRDVATACGVPEDRVRVVPPDVGGGFGSKISSQVVVEAARLARAAGQPVRLAWTREEEMTLSHVRPAGVIRVTSGVSKDGALVAWEFHNFNSGNAAMGTPYDVPDQLIEFRRCAGPLRQGPYRSLAATANFWAREMHMDELAVTLGMDPLAFRLANTLDARLRTAYETAAEHFGWGDREPQPGRGFGIAGGIEKGAHLATCAEVSVDPDSRQVKVERIVAAFDCGAIINPRQLEGQVEGGAVMALGGALFEAVEFGDGRILDTGYSTYRVPRFSDAPHIEVVLIDRRDIQPAGAGETPMCTIAPAIGNAIIDATGVHLHSLPMAPDGVPEG